MRLVILLSLVLAILIGIAMSALITGAPVLPTSADARITTAKPIPSASPSASSANDLPTQEPTEIDTATSVPLDLPTDTPTQAVADTPTDTPTDSPTDTPTAMPADTASPTETAIDTATSTPLAAIATSTPNPDTPTPPSSPTPRRSTPTRIPPIPTSPPTAIPPAVPVLGTATNIGGAIVLSWSYPGQLASDVYFDVRVWQSGQVPSGIANVKDTSYVIGGSFPSGTYNWTIAVIRRLPDGSVETLSIAASTSTFTWSGASHPGGCDRAANPSCG